MIAEAESAFTVSTDLRAERVWLVNKLQYQSKFKWEDSRLKSQNFH